MGPYLHRLYIQKFWDQFGAAKNDGYGYHFRSKLKVLREYSKIVIPYDNQMPRSIRRATFDRVKYDRRSLKAHKLCFVCLKPADIRHHIIMLNNGGINSKRNLVSLCKSCHSEIHPWLR